MLKVRKIKCETIETNIDAEFETTDQYYWWSRCVNAVEFKFDIYKGSEFIMEPTNEMKLIRIDFEENIIRTKIFTWSDKRPINLTFKFSGHEFWIQELLDEFFEGKGNRTKEQFYQDFDNVISNLTTIRNNTKRNN